jgi:hypothetical protein
MEMNYYVFKQRELYQIQDLVNQHIEQGYMPVGGPNHIVIEEDGVEILYFYQAIYKPRGAH